MSLPRPDAPRRPDKPARERSVDPLDADSTFQWPPSDESVSDLLLFPNEEPDPVREPKSRRAQVPPRAAGAGTNAQSPPSPVNDPSYEALQQRLRSAPSAQPDSRSSAPSVPASAKAGRQPAPTIPSRRTRSGVLLLAVAVAVLALLVVVQALYIFRPGWFRATEAPAPPAAATPVKPAPDPAATDRADPSEQPTGTTGIPVPAAPSGRLNIRSEPSGATVSIDGRPYGVTPLALSNVRPGELRVVLKSAGREIRQTVHVEAGATASLIVPMAAATPPAPSPATRAVPATTGSGWVAIASAAELDIMEDDVLVGSTRSPRVMMPAGVHTLRLVNTALGFETTQQVRVEPGQVARVNVTLPDGTLHLNAQPWAEVLLDGKPVGETPIGNLPVRIGTHQIVFRHPELGEKTVSTVVKAGSASRVAVDLRK